MDLRKFVQDKLAELKEECAEMSRIERDERAAERAHTLLVLEMKAKGNDEPESMVVACENKMEKNGSAEVCQPNGRRHILGAI